MESDYAYSTHQPILNWILSHFQPFLAVEIGVGYFSTPLLFKWQIPAVFHIENDEAWLDKIEALKPDGYQGSFVLHKIGDRVNDQGIRWKALTPEEQNCITWFYEGLNFGQYKNPRLLFVDGYACCRMKAMEILKDQFDFIVYHDAELTGQLANDYNFSTGFEDFRHYVLKSPRTWTGILIRKGIHIEHINLWHWVSLYEKENNIKMELYERSIKDTAFVLG
jgi:hypothetical protein